MEKGSGRFFIREQRKSIVLSIMKRALFLFGISFIFAGCLERENFPDEPRLLSGRLDVAGAGGTMVLSFTDGNGNFGLEEGDTTGLFDPCIRRWNLYAEY
jgi:hypothetical protein